MHMEGKISDFQWDISVDASVFNPIIPEDYTTAADGPIKMPEMTEETAIAGLKLYRDYTDQYPEDMGMMAIIGSMKKMQDSNTPAARAYRESMKDLGKEAMKDLDKEAMKDMDKEAMSKAISKALTKTTTKTMTKTMTNAMLDLMMPIQATVGFYAQLVQQKKDPAYYGDIVTPDQPDLVLMRWKIEDNQYRVIFSDLSAETVTRQRLAELENALPKEESP